LRVLGIQVDRLYKILKCFLESRIFRCLNCIFLRCLSSFNRIYVRPMNVVIEVRMLRIDAPVEPSVWPVAPKQCDLATTIMRVIDQPDREVLRKVLILAHEHREVALASVGCNQFCIVAQMCPVQLHFPLWRIGNLLRAGDQLVKFVLAESGHWSAS